MPMGFFEDTINQAWNNKSEFQAEREREATANMPPPSVTPVPVQPPDAVVVPQQEPTRITQLVNQGAPLTAQQYKTGVIDYLMTNKGYSYEDAARLMAPSIAAYEQQESANNERLSYELAAKMENNPIDSTDYRMNALKLLKLNPALGKFYLKEGIGRRDLWNRQNVLADRAAARQQKLSDMQYNADLQIQNKMRWQQLQEAYAKQQALNKVKQLMDVGYDEKTATAAVLGVGNRIGGMSGNAAGVGIKSSEIKDLKNFIDGLNEQASNIEASGGQVPNDLKERILHFQKQYDTYYNNRFGYQNWQQKVDNLISRNGGIDENLVRALRAGSGLQPDDANPNHPINQYLAAKGYRGTQRRTVREEQVYCERMRSRTFERKEIIKWH